jgi:hypothetical protein
MAGAGEVGSRLLTFRMGTGTYLYAYPCLVYPLDRYALDLDALAAAAALVFQTQEAS